MQTLQRGLRKLGCRAVKRLPLTWAGSPRSWTSDCEVGGGMPHCGCGGHSRRWVLEVLGTATDRPHCCLGAKGPFRAVLQGQEGASHVSLFLSPVSL